MSIFERRDKTIVLDKRKGNPTKQTINERRLFVMGEDTTVWIDPEGGVRIFDPKKRLEVSESDDVVHNQGVGIYTLSTNLSHMTIQNRDGNLIKVTRRPSTTIFGLDISQFTDRKS